MAAPSVQTLQRLAEDTGHQLGTLEKVVRLLDLLQEIARDPALSNRLALKGGTALNVFHLDIDRLSVDIDLNYIGALDRAVMVAERPALEAASNRTPCRCSRGSPGMFGSIVDTARSGAEGRWRCRTFRCRRRKRADIVAVLVAHPEGVELFAGGEAADDQIAAGELVALDVFFRRTPYDVLAAVLRHELGGELDVFLHVVVEVVISHTATRSGT